MTEYPQRLVSLAVRAKPPLERLAAVQAVLARCRAELGAGGRVLLRYSGTENKLRLLVEAPQAERVEHWARELAAAIARDVGA